MRWTYLGHASWLADVAGLRLLFDPVFSEPHHGGVFEVWPPRRIDVDAIRADFLFVSHAHPDHFHPASLRALAVRDPDTVVVTPDPFVATSARRLGFRTVRDVPAGQRIDLDGATVVTTPSMATQPEWGAVVIARGGAVWNQVDTVLRDAGHVRTVVQALALGRPLDLALVRWQPMLEIAVLLGDATTFPLSQYADLLDQIVATGAHSIVPSAAGERHVGASAWMNRFVFPVGERRFLRDIARAAPDVRPLPAVVGGAYVVDGGAHLAAERSPLVELPRASDDPRDFHPITVPAVSDPNPRGRTTSEILHAVAPWLETDLPAALARAYPSFDVDAPLRFSVEVVMPGATHHVAIEVGSNGATVRRDDRDDDWDALNVIAGSLLAEVLEGRQSWADVLLSGAYRAHVRAYRAGTGGVRRANVGPTFLYYALPYDESVRRSVEREIDALLSREGPSDTASA